jgi:hypothetical protein
MNVPSAARRKNNLLLLINSQLTVFLTLNGAINL